MARFRLMSDPETGNVAIFKVLDADPSDDEPLNDPFNNLDRLQIHSGLVVPSTTPELTQEVDITIPAQSANSKYSGQINLFAHGKGAPCMVEGVIKGIGVGGVDVAFNGTMPVDVHTTGHATWLALGATDTHVVLVYFGITYELRSALNLTIEASAYDLLDSGPAPAGNPSDPLIEHVPQDGATPPYLTMGRGKIDTRRRYISKVDAGGDFALAIGPTLSIIGRGISGSGSYVQDEIGWRWRYSCAGYTKETLVAWDGSSTDGGDYEAPYIQVKR